MVDGVRFKRLRSMFFLDLFEILFFENLRRSTLVADCFCCCDICDVCRVSRNRLLILPISPCVDGRAVKKRGLGPSEKHRDEKTTSRTQIAELSSRMVREMKDSFSFLFSLSVFLY